MRPVIVALVGLMGAWWHANDARASEPDVVHFRLGAGICAVVSPKGYSDVADFDGVSEIISVGATLSPRRFASGSLDFNFINLGRGTPSGLTSPDTVTTVEPSSLVSAQVGLEVRRPSADGHGPYLSGAIGWGRAFLGGVSIRPFESAGTSTYPGTRLTGPVLAAGMGYRTSRILDGPHLQIEARLISLLARSRTVSLMPVTLGFLF
jgi:hypothetical protein